MELNKKKFNKKGMFFTLIVISLLSLFLVSYNVYSFVLDRSPINNRIKTMNNFVFSVEQDLSRQLYISGFRIIFLFEKLISEEGNYITSFNETFNEAFQNGTIYGESQELMNGVTFSEIEDSINQKGSGINVNISLTNPNISVTQEDPWNIKVSLEVNLLISDKSNLASWDRTSIITAHIPIENFEDPIYVVNTNGMVTNKINQTPYTDFIDGGNVYNLLSHVQNSYYINSSLAPSFLDRLQGKLSANENGIESLVYLPELSGQGISVSDKSVVDYIYFSLNNPSTNSISGMPSWFKLDTAHLSIYD